MIGSDGVAMNVESDQRRSWSCGLGGVLERLSLSAQALKGYRQSDRVEQLDPSNPNAIYAQKDYHPPSYFRLQVYYSNSRGTCEAKACSSIPF